ncbi:MULTISPECIES: hypothetical protein [unclassified Bartonella]
MMGPSAFFIAVTMMRVMFSFLGGGAWGKIFSRYGKGDMKKRAYG